MNTHSTSFSDMLQNIVGLVVLTVVFFIAPFGVMFVPKIGGIIAAIVTGFCGYYIAGFSAPSLCKFILGISTCSGLAFALFKMKVNGAFFISVAFVFIFVFLIGYFVEREVRSRRSRD